MDIRAELLARAEEVNQILTEYLPQNQITRKWIIP